MKNIDTLTMRRHLKPRCIVWIACMVFVSLHGSVATRFPGAIFRLIDSIAVTNPAIPYLTLGICGYLAVVFLVFLLPATIVAYAARKFGFGWFWPGAAWTTAYILAFVRFMQTPPP